MITQIAGYLSGIAILLSFIPYARDIFLKKTKPEKMSWFIWAVLGSILFFSQLAEGAHYSLIMTGVQALGDLFIFVLAIKLGIGGFLKRDIFALICAAISLFLWYITKNAAIALFIVIFIDATGAILTIIKSYEHPETETVSSWALTSIAGFMACIAVGKFDLVLLAFPFYTGIITFAIVVSIKLGFIKRNKILTK
ncbi:MAG: hypothetical protein NT094_04855 [Candidatus Staskawiczbacteria bacterium]|nr:hypothetical protein [Candidatus Staskawiczbacteria bacterium]